MPWLKQLEGRTTSDNKLSMQGVRLQGHMLDLGSDICMYGPRGQRTFFFVLEGREVRNVDAYQIPRPSDNTSI